MKQKNRYKASKKYRKKQHDRFMVQLAEATLRLMRTIADRMQPIPKFPPGGPVNTGMAEVGGRFMRVKLPIPKYDKAIFGLDLAHTKGDRTKMFTVNAVRMSYKQLKNSIDKLRGESEPSNSITWQELMNKKRGTNDDSPDMDAKDKMTDPNV